MRIGLALIASATLIMAGEASAWNSRGHMIVAAVAWDRLDSAVRAKVTALIKLNPHYATWTQGVATNARDKAAFVKAATWADEIKSEAGYSDTLPGGATPGIAYDDKLKHRDWHYKDLPFSTDGTPTQPAPDPNALTQIDAFKDALASNATPDAVKSYDLVWLLHLVGDVHQPLHATSRFTAADTDGDTGGNDVTVCPITCNSTPIKLHAFWDDALGTSKSATSAISKAGTLAPASATKAAILDPQKWLEESLVLAKSKAYKSPIGPKKGPYKLTSTYKASAGSVAEGQVALAGARLANLLNAALEN